MSSTIETRSEFRGGSSGNTQRAALESGRHGQTMIVNAAFLQEVKESNLQLWGVLSQLRAVQLGQPRPTVLAKQFVNNIGELRDAIGLEFSLEETYGFVSGVPRVSITERTDASKAIMQHRELYLQLHELCEQAEEAQYRGTIARDLPVYLGAFDAFDTAFRAHEELESELIRCGLGVRRRTI